VRPSYVESGRAHLYPADAALLPENEPEKVAQFRFRAPGASLFPIAIAIAEYRCYVNDVGATRYDPTIKAIRAEAYSWLRKPDYIANNVYEKTVKTKLRAE
jgi:hypothetical protein